MYNAEVGYEFAGPISASFRPQVILFFFENVAGVVSR